MPDSQLFVDRIPLKEWQSFDAPQPGGTDNIYESVETWVPAMAQPRAWGDTYCVLAFGNMVNHDISLFCPSEGRAGESKLSVYRFPWIVDRPDRNGAENATAHAVAEGMVYSSGQRLGEYDEKALKIAFLGGGHFVAVKAKAQAQESELEESEDPNYNELSDSDSDDDYRMED